MNHRKIDLFESRGAIVVRSPTDETQTIATTDEWFLHAPPMGGLKHWKDGRSAKEVAKTWCRATGVAAPQDLLELVRSHPLTATFEPATAIPECPTALRGERGGRRKHDLVVFGKAGSKRVLVGVEAKTDEPFDDPLDERVDQARELLEAKTPTAQLARIERLTGAIFGRSVVQDDMCLDPVLRGVPYQLVTGLAGTLIEADQRAADIAVFAVHAFHSSELDEVAVQRNNDDFERLLIALAHEALTMRDRVLHGPFEVPGGGGVPPGSVLVGMTTSLL